MPLKIWRKETARFMQVLALSTPLLLAGSSLAHAAADGSPKADDTPTFNVGVTVYGNYTYTDTPTKVDQDGNTYHPSDFDISRAYINVFGRINHLVSYRVTPDVKRQATSCASSDPNVSVSCSSSIDGSLSYRLKYAYGQFNLDDSWGKGSWVRFGLHHTPYIDWNEHIYRYRWQGTIFAEREGFLSSSDFGASTHYSFPGGFGDVHAGYYNGETYGHGEANAQKAIEARVSIRPAPHSESLKGLLITGFYDADKYTKSDPRTRLIGAVTYANKHVHAGFEYLDAKDQPAAASPEVKSNGYTVWATPIFPKGWEALLRYDSFKPDKDIDARKNRKIGGVAYWFHTKESHAKAALLLDYESVGYDEALGKPDEKRYAIHSLFEF